MKKRGFTLVELLGVIIILGLLALVTIPTISDSLSKYKKKLCNTQIEYMITAAKNWGADHIYQLPEEGETVKISLSELIKQGYMEGDQKASQEDRYKVKNPRSQKYFDPDPTITITKTGNKVNYAIDETTQNSCTGVKRDYKITVLGVHTTLQNGKTITNQIVNGSFEDGANGWSNTRVDTPTNTVSGAISTARAVTGTHSLYINDTGSGGYWNYQKITANNGDVVYTRENLYLMSGVANSLVTKADETHIAKEIITSKPLNKLYLNSRTYTHGSDVGYYQYGTCLSCLGEVYADDIMVINLTQAFGAGNEPSKEEMDRVAWFDGTAQITSTTDYSKATFTVSPETGYTLPSTITCSSGKGTIQNGVLTISGVNENTYCVVESTK